MFGAAQLPEFKRLNSKLPKIVNILCSVHLQYEENKGFAAYFMEWSVPVVIFLVILSFGIAPAL